MTTGKPCGIIMKHLSAFSGAAADNMACFIAGTLVLTTAGLLAIEKINPGDKVISTDPDTLETSEKTVLETYTARWTGLFIL